MHLRRISATLIGLLILSGAVLYSAPAAAPGGPAAEGEHLVFFLPSKESAIFNQIDLLCKTIGKKIGVPVKMMTVADIPIKNPTMAQLVKWAKSQVEKKAIDMTVVTPTGLFSIMDENIKFMPIATYEIDKKKTDRPCIFVKRGSPYTKLAGDAEKIAALKGKRVGIGHGVKSNPVADMLLLDHGINTPSFKYFDIVGTFGGVEDKLKDTVAGRLEGFITMKVDLKFLFNKNKQYADTIEPLVCGNEYTNMPFIVRDGLDPEIVGKLRKVFLTMHKDKDFAQMHFLFYAVNGHFTPVTMDDYKNWETVYKKGRKEGWLDEIGQMILPGEKSH